MHRPIFGHSFAVLVAPILLSVLAFKFLNKKKTGVGRNAEDADAGVPGLSTETNLGEPGSSAALIEINNGASCSPSVPSGDHYDVFLNFRGLDTRNNFASHLYYGLIDAGIHAFRDDDELQQGEEIGPGLLTAIKSSKILILILSVNYGSSRWCLDELVQIMECKNESKGCLVLPIFYKVEPTHVRHQKEKFGDAFRTHEGRFGSAILEKWKQALKEVSNLKGWTATGDEGKLVKLVVQKVLSKLKKDFELVVPENLVGIDSHVKEVMKFVDNNSSATQFVGIHGMGGIGKTTLAKTIYNKLSNQFEHCGYILDIRESLEHNDLVYLQNQLISDLSKPKKQVNNKNDGIGFLSSRFIGKKVLILLDDVDDDGQLNALAGNSDWFSSGSRILITTRNKSILDNRVDHIYELEEMNLNQSLILFSRHAFRSNFPTNFKDLAYEVVSITGGLPLALEVIGSHLCGKGQAQWVATLEKLRKVPNWRVRDKLKISYDALDPPQQQIFLDVACFLIGIDRRSASYMWDVYDFFPDDSLEVLRFMSLIKIGNNQELRMHAQLRDLGREIVRNEDLKPQFRSRLWDSKEVWKVLKGNKGTNKIEAISLTKGNLKGFRETADQGGDILTNEQFKNLTCLRFLHVNGAHFIGDFNKSFEELTYLRWQNCPLTFEASNFSVKELVVLDLSGSQISDEWQGWSSVKTAEELKFLDLTSCESLRRTIFLSGFKNLEFLILRDCRRLEKIDSSIGDMKLKFLDLTSCVSLRSTVFLSAFENLGVLIFRDCEELEKIDSSIGEMKSLVLLDLTRCGSLEELPVELGKLEAVEQLLVRDCPNISIIPDMGTLQHLEILHICGTGIKELPKDVGRLRNLRDLDASRCKQLRGEMLESFHNLASLQRLDFDGCKELQSLPNLPSNLTYLSITCQSRRLPSFSHLTHLKELRLLDCRFLECFQLTDVEESESTKSPNTPFKLEILKIYGCKFMETLDVSKLNQLRILSIENCTTMFEVRGLDKLKCLESLTIIRCASIVKLDLPKSEHLKILDARYCQNLVNIQGLDLLKSKGLKIFRS